MRKVTIKGLSCIAACILTAPLLSSCLDSNEETIVLETATNVTGIPDDSEASSNPVITNPTTNVPNIQTTLDEINGQPVIRLDMTGVQDPSTLEWIKLFGTGFGQQNIWVEVDDTPKGILVYNNSDQEDGKTIMTDIVFTVDNSGSMSEEANTIARDIISWSEQLMRSGLDARFGIVGYGGYVSGAINLTSASELSTYLNYASGTDRTAHFGGADATTLQSYASSFPKTSYSISSNECGAMAIEFADKYFSFRSGANRIYVNFTDEPNQPSNNHTYSVEYFNSQSNWPAYKGTVHTVFSDTQFTGNSLYVSEKPWLISQYTGGTSIFTNSSFTGVTLASLPVTGAMQNSYIIRFTNISELLDGKQHKVHITIRSTNGSTTADKTFYVIFGS